MSGGPPSLAHPATIHGRSGHLADDAWSDRHQQCTYVGYAVTQSVWGAVVTTIAVCLPSFILVLLISYFFVKCKDNKYIKAAMSGLLPMSVSLIAAAALLLMNKENFIDYKSILIFAAAFGVTWKWNLHPILLIILAGVAGFLLY